MTGFLIAQGPWINITNHTITDDASASGFTTAIARYRILASGVADNQLNIGSASVYAAEWANAAAYTARYDVQVVVTGSALTVGSSASGSFLNCGSDRAWAITNATTSTHTSSLAVTIRDTNSTNTVATATISLSATGDATGGGGCVVIDSWLSPRQQAGDVATQDIFLTRDENGLFLLRRIEKVGPPRLEECVRLEAEGGAVLRCSNTTPFNLRLGPNRPLVRCAPNMLGFEVLVTRDGITSWEKIVRADPIGKQWIVPIDFGGFSFSAGDDPTNMIFNHNKTIP